MNTLKSRLRSPLAVIAFNVVVAHAAGLAWLQTSGPRPFAGKTHGAQAVHLRLAQAAPPKPVLAAPADQAQRFRNIPQAPDTRPVPTPEKAAVEPADSPMQLQPALDTSGASAPFDVDSVLAGLDDGDGSPASDNYIPRPQLTVAPRTTTAVLVPFPPDVAIQGRFTTVLALFIDEHGIVRRVRVDGPSLPAPMEEAARQTFLQTQFQPGEVQGQAVKSLIRIEVVFDNTPIQPAPPVRVAQSM